jgi:predicted permease
MFSRRRRQRERDLDREIQNHLELEAAERQELDVSSEEARYAARRAFGNTTLVKEEIRNTWTWAAVDHMARDLRYALRAIRNNPGFSAAAILSLALGIGANTAIFSLINALLLRSLPVHKPAELDQLVLVEQGHRGDSFDYPAIGALAAQTDIFAGLCGFTSASFNVTSSGGSERIPGAWVTGGYYRTLGIEPLAGRLLTPDDSRPGSPPVAVLSYSYWESRFARDFGVIGRSIQIEGRPVRIVGVSPKGFSGANVGDAANLTLPLATLPQLFPERAPLLEAGAQWLRVLARPLPGISNSQVKARLAVVWPRMASISTTPRMNAKRRQVLLNSSIDLIPGGSGWSTLRGQFRRPLIILLALTGLVLLIACANFANLLLARGTARSKDIALRFAIGASRQRIVRQLLTESVMLSVAGAVLGILLAALGSRALVALLSSGRRDAVLLDLRPDSQALLFTSVVALATGILFGLIPALRATAFGPGTALKAESGITPRTRSRLLPALVVLQVALSLVLLIGAGLFVRTFKNLEELDPGFRRDGVLIVNVDARRAGYKEVALAGVYRALLEKFATLPGVVSVSLSSNTPLSGGIWSAPVSIDGQPSTRESAHFNTVAPRYFETMGTPIVLGRDFNEGDRPGAPGSAIVNEAFARKYLPEGRALGHQIVTSSPRYPSFEIVGVVKDAVSQSLREPAPPSVYLPYFQYSEAIGIASFEIRVAVSMSRIAALVRNEIRARFPATPVQSQVRTLGEQVDATLTQERMLATLGTCFGMLALILAAVGVYGVLAYTVARSTNEIGLRIALGAKRQQVLGLVLKSACGMLVLGIALGIPAAWAGSGLIASMLFGLQPTDPLTILLAMVVLGVTAIVAAFVPGLRASRIDPMIALRYE